MTRALATPTNRGATSRGAHSGHEALAKGLGVFSIGLGLAELLAPRAFCQAFGMKDREALFRAYGARELATGVAILMSHDPTPWLWGRVGGDAMDLATLGQGLSDTNPRRDAVSLATAAVVGVTILDVICASGLTADKRIPSEPRFDYRDRSGFPRSSAAMRGAAAASFDVPADFRVPEPLRPWTGDGPRSRGTADARA